MALAAALWTVPARGDLASDVDELMLAWRTLGDVERLRPELLERGDVRPIPLDPRRIDPENPDCITVAVLGTPGANFVLRFLPLLGEPPLAEDEWPETSVAGAAQITRCGARKTLLPRLAVEMRSPRAVVETVVARSSALLPTFRRALPHRDPGPLFPSAETGPRPMSLPLKRRASRLQERAKREGAQSMAQKLLSSDASGNGSAVLPLEAGCHRLDVLSPGASERALAHGIDVDIEVALAATGEVLASDATESADASAAFCLGAPQPVRLRFVGSVPGVPVLLLESRWELPGGLPEYWSAEARGHMAEALRRHHHRGLGNLMVYESLGVPGATLLPVEVEPGACYVAVVAPLRGHSASLALAAAVGDRFAQNHGGLEGRGTALSFCSRSENVAQLEVEARGSGLVWLLAVWQASRLGVGEVPQ